MDQFNKFSQDAKKILKIAQKIADDMNTSVGTDHILLALASTADTLSSEILRNNNISVDRIHLTVSLSRLNKSESVQGLTSEAKRLLGKAMLKAKEFGQAEVSPEHLFLALLSDSNFVGYQILEDLGIDCNQLHDQLLSSFAGSKPEEESNEPNSPFEMMDEFFGDKGDLDKLGEAMSESFLGKALQAVKPRRSADSALDYFTIDLNKRASAGDLDPIVGRDKEMQRVLRILNRRTKNNPVLVGEPGVGKTAIVEGLAQKIVAGLVPKNIADKRILVLDLALLLAGTKYRGEFEERIKKVTKEIIDAKDIILFIDELHTLVGAGSAEGVKFINK